jgi:hypothetical protein
MRGGFRGLCAVIGIGAALALGAAACSSSAPKAVAPTTTASTTIAPAPTSMTLPSTATPVATTCPTDARRYTPAELEAVRAEVEKALLKGNDFVSYGTGIHAVEIELQPGREKLAAALEARFRGAVSITVGGAPYHCGVGTAPKCAAIKATSTLPAGLHLALRLGRTTMRADDSFNASLLVKNDGPKPLGMDPGEPIVALIVRPGTRTVVGTYSGPIGGTGLGLNLHDGQSHSVKTIVSGWRCDGRPGSTLPPGRYGVLAGISSNEGPPQLLAPEAPLTITS